MLYSSAGQVEATPRYDQGSNPFAICDSLDKAPNSHNTDKSHREVKVLDYGTFNSLGKFVSVTGWWGFLSHVTPVGHATISQKEPVPVRHHRLTFFLDIQHPNGIIEVGWLRNCQTELAFKWKKLSSKW